MISNGSRSTPAPVDNWTKKRNRITASVQTSALIENPGFYVN